MKKLFITLLLGLFLISFASSAINVTLNYPTDSSIEYTNLVTTNASANVTGGAYLINATLYDNSTGTWEARNSSSTINTINTDGLVSYYKLDENTANTTVVDSYGSNLGTSSSNTNTLYNASGVINSAFNLDGSSQFVNLTNSFDGGIYGSTSFSISIWFNQDASEQVSLVSDHLAGADKGTAIILRNNGLTYNFATTLQGWDFNEGTINTGNWYNYILTYESGVGFKLYKNGALQDSSGVISGTIRTQTRSLLLGADTGNINNLDGRLDEIGFWNKSLSSTEAAEIYNLGTGSMFTTNITKTFTNTYASGSNILWNYQFCDTDGDCGFATSNYTFSIDGTAPTITLNYPTSLIDYGKLNGTLQLNLTATDTNLDKVWYNYNGTNITILGALTGVNNLSNITLSTKKNITIYANDTAGNLNTTTFTWDYKVFENNRTYNITSYETSSETFQINVEGVTTVSLFYNGTEYTTTKSGNYFTKVLQVPINNLGNRSFYWEFDGTQNSYTSYQNVSQIVFTLCNATYTDDYLNISFKDETGSEVINASITSSTFTYYLGDGTVTKTYSFINSSNNYNYLFCATPNIAMQVLPYVQYKQGTDYPQRIWNPSVQTLNTTVKNEILYLLSSIDGIYVTFQTINTADQILSGVDISAIREIAGLNVTVSVGTTSSSGTVTFWLNPDFLHYYSFIKTGLTSYFTSFAPTQSSYTITMGSDIVSQNSSIKGIDYSFLPSDNFLNNDTEYTFSFNLTSSFWDIEEYGFNLRLANGTIITGDSTGVEGTELTKLYNVNNQSVIYLDAYWLIGDTYTNVTRVWSIQNTEYSGWSIKTFFEDLKLYLDSGLFGLDNFGRYLITFIIIFVFVGVMGYKFGISSPLGIISLLFGIVFFFDVVTGLLPAIRGIEHLPTFIAGLILILAVLSEVQSR
jgi:hypothetical protein